MCFILTKVLRHHKAQTAPLTMISVARTVAECVTTEPFDYILVTLKALPEVYNVADIIAPAVTENTTLVLIQNGLGVEEPMVAKFPNNPLISIVAYISTSQHEPGTITMLAKESLIVGKYLKSKCSSDKQQSLFVEHLKKGGVQVDVVEDVEQVRWQKLIWYEFKDHQRRCVFFFF